MADQAQGLLPVSLFRLPVHGNQRVPRQSVSCVEIHGENELMMMALQQKTSVQALSALCRWKSTRSQPCQIDSPEMQVRFNRKL